MEKLVSVQKPKIVGLIEHVGLDAIEDLKTLPAVARNTHLKDRIDALEKFTAESNNKATSLEYCVEWFK